MRANFMVHRTKKLLMALIMTLLLIPSVLIAGAETPKTVIASGTCGANGDNLTWTLYDTGVLSIRGEGAMMDYASSSVVPWYANRIMIKTIEFPDGITTIGNYAFQNCSNLLSVTIPEGVTVIGNNAFHSCSNLSSITIPESVTALKQYAFGTCIKLSEINYNAKAAKDLTSESRVFWHAGTDVKGGGITVSFGAGVEKIPAYLFYADTTDSRYYPNVMSVTIPYSVTSIGKYAFDKCTQMVNVYYRSTKEAWGRISIGSNNQPLKNADFNYITVCDINGDGTISNADLTMLLRHVAKISLIEDTKLLKQVDFDYSGTVDAVDVTILAQHLKK